MMWISLGDCWISNRYLIYDKRNKYTKAHDLEVIKEVGIYIKEVSFYIKEVNIYIE
jgi:hypothetical protein